MSSTEGQPVSPVSSSLSSSSSGPDVYSEEHPQAPPREYVAQSCCTNCIISSALGALLCRRGCDASRVIADFAFFPPSPPTYLLKKTKEKPLEVPPSPKKKNVFSRRHRKKATTSNTRDEDSIVGCLEWKYRDLDRNPAFGRFRVVDGKEGRPICRFLETNRHERVPCFYFPSENTSDSFVLIYFHANATDCGVMLPTYASLRSRLGLAVLAVEYTGYGGSTGSPSVAATYADAEAAYDEARRLGFKDEKIILYGQSVGSGPACRLATTVKNCAGLVLHSPIASGIRSLTGGGYCSPIYIFSCLDPFNNLKELRQVECPVFVIHGAADEEIPVAHGHMLYEAARNKHDAFWVPNAGHNNVLETNQDDYFYKLTAFLQRLKDNDNALLVPEPIVPTLDPKVLKKEKKQVIGDSLTKKTNKTAGGFSIFFRGWWHRLKTVEDHHNNKNNNKTKQVHAAATAKDNKANAP